MAEKSADDVTPGQAVSLAEEYLERHRMELSSDRGQTYEQTIEQWQERKQGLDEDDPLYDVAEERIQEAKIKLDELQSGSEEVKTQLLRVVADGFLAEGDWLDERLLRALNMIFFDKYSPTLVIRRQVLEEGMDLTDDNLYAISKAIRDRAREELEE